MPGSVVATTYGTELVYERHRHRFEVNPRYRARLEAAGLVSSGTSPDDRLVEFIELAGHPFWVGTQAHPEFKSRPDHPHPLFAGPGGRGSGAGRTVERPGCSMSTALPSFRKLAETEVHRGSLDHGDVGPLRRLRTAPSSNATSCITPARSSWCR